MLSIEEFEKLLADLRRVHDSMRFNEHYENAWLNYPDEPAESPGDIIRGILKELEQ